MLIIPYISLLFMGAVVGLVGGGGGILTVPILVYLFHFDPILATHYSLVIVGATALVWVLIKWKSGDIVWKVALAFGIPSIPAAFFSRHTLVPTIPDHIWLIEKGTLLLLVFGAIMLGAGCSMACKRKAQAHQSSAITGWKKAILTLFEWLVVGTITGLVGAGGGFLIVPALMLLEWLAIGQAAATSLVIIASNALIGSLGGLGNPNLVIDSSFLVTAIATSLVGLVLGILLQKNIRPEKLSRWFGVFVMAMAVFMIAKQFFS